MRGSRIDRAFHRYRRTGDPRLLGRVFDATAKDLFRLAWYLVGDRQVAEDLVQTTYLTAIEAAADFASDREVMPWLCGILANRARDLRRQRARRTAAAVDPRLDVVDPVGEAVAREVYAEVTRALRGLPPLYREVLTLHLEQGLVAHEVASRLSRPQATVRSQIHRGLDMLRRALPAGLASAGAGAMAPAVDLSAMRSVVVGPGAAAAVGWITTAITMKKAIALVVVLSIAATAILWPHPPGVSSASSADAGAAAALGSASPLASKAAPEQSVGAPRELVMTPATGLEVMVNDAAGAPVAACVVTWEPARSRGELAARSATTDASGLATFVGDVQGPGHVSTARGGWLKVDVVVGEVGKAVLELPGAVEVSGVVADEAGRPIAGAEVWLSHGGGRGEAVTRSAPDGRFVLRAASAGCWLAAWTDDRRPARGVEVPSDAGECFDCRLIVEHLGRTVEGFVTDEQGRPVGGATVLFAETGALDRHRLDAWESPLRLPRRLCTTAADGRFRITSLPPIATQVWAASPEHAAWRGQLAAGTAAEQLSIQLQAGAIVSGRVSEQDGSAAVGVRIESKGPWPTGPWDGGPSWSGAYGTTDPEGVFVLAHLSPGDNTLMARRGAELCSTQRNLVNGESASWNPRFGVGPRFAGTVVSPHGAPLADWEVQLRGAANFSRRTDAAGEFAIDVLDATYSLWLVEPRLGIAVLRLPPQAPPTERLRIEVPRARFPDAVMTGAVWLDDGQPASGASFEFVHLGDDGATSEFANAECKGERFVSGPMYPGRYLLRVTLPEVGTLRAGPFVLVGGQTTDVGTLRFERPGEVTVRLLTAPQEAPGEAGRRRDLVLLRSEREPLGVAVEVTGDEARLGSLQPGGYFVSTRGPAVAATRHFVVTPGSDLVVDLVVPEGVRCLVRYPAPPCDGHLLHLVWRNAGGEVVYDTFGSNDKREHGFDMPLLIAAGTYTIRVEDGGGNVAETTTTIVAADPPVVVELPLPGPGAPAAK